ncbi:cephalosporin hydroxylase family protein [Undibacterium sp.]|uniref:cephalosporin hydroxylase family protein n=1 Tax=Undibacterium sp. TaxID=1914977 RepID=UPI00272F0EFD|nr:cephalosporin hydroxylase family protein [Undibacterium sp.]MDP1980246.1 cephalosporin hydroxylase family protein [Undibacterium sp.]
MTEHENFKAECQAEVAQQGTNTELKELTNQWISTAAEHKYSYHFEWLGRPIIQHPQDMIGLQQLLWNIQPDLVIETGIARGGSLIFSASILELIALCGGNPDAKVLGIDIDIRDHNRQAILEHPMSKRIEMIQGSSIAADIVESVHKFAAGYKKILVCLDSNHTHDHVLEELKLYAPLVSKGSYCVVFDTIIEDLPAGSGPVRPWGKSNNPKTAVWEYLKQLEASNATGRDDGQLNFIIDKEIENQLLITVAPDGFLKRV